MLSSSSAREQIRELYDLLATPKTYPVVLYHGPTGVGKSSILEAGLLPRLERDFKVIALRPRSRPRSAGHPPGGAHE